MAEQFPGVVDLNVCGTHYRALLSTLTKDEDSKLAAMFTGQLPVYKDRDDRYFIEADGFTFKAILHYLRYDELPFQEAGNYPQNGAVFGFGRVDNGGNRQGGLFGDRKSGYTARNIEMMYHDALNLGLSKLAKHLEKFQPNFVNIKMDEYRKSVRGYDECFAKLLNIIPAECLFHKTEFTIRIKQDLQTIEEEKCCEHECKMMPGSSFGQPYYTTIDAEVRVRFEVNPTVLSALAIDFQQRGYLVQGRMTVCEFSCKKEVKQSRFIVFSGQARKCCAEELFLLTFKWDTEAAFVNHPGFFGTKQFGRKAMTGGLFGAQQSEEFSFGTSAQKQTGSGLFGGGQQGGFGPAQTPVFGQDQSSGFGQAQPSSFGQGMTSSFGEVQTTGFHFGQQQGSSTQANPFGFGTAKQGSLGQTGGFGLSFAQQQQSAANIQSPEEQQQLSKQNTFSFASTTSQQQGSGIFSPPKFSFGQHTGQQKGSGLFGSSAFSQQSTNSGLSGGTSVGSTGGFRFSSPPLSSSSLNLQPQKQQSAFSGKGDTFGSTPSGQLIFGNPSKKTQPVFGGTPSFESKFSGLSLQQTPEQSFGNTTTSIRDKGSMLFGKPAGVDSSGKQHSEVSKNKNETDG